MSADHTTGLLAPLSHPGLQRSTQVLSRHIDPASPQGIGGSDPGLGDSAFDDLGAPPGDFDPPPLRAEIDALNERICQTVNLQHIQRHCCQSHHRIHPTGVVPRGLEIDFLAPHERDRLC
jgi:glutathionyl-hydroquinone reductase